ncbi:phage tail assembly chaperone [Devosia epidermidihirudinis]
MAGADERPVSWPPELLPGADELLSAFWALCSDRQVAMSEGPIPFSAINQWAARQGVDGGDEFATLMRCVRVMDDEWLKSARRHDGQVEGRPLTPELFDAVFR